MSRLPRLAPVHRMFALIQLRFTAPSGPETGHGTGFLRLPLRLL